MLVLFGSSLLAQQAFFVTGVTLPGVTLLQVLGLGVKGCVLGVGFGGQGGVGSGMSSMRLVGPTGRDQSYVSTGDPSFRKGAGKASGKGGSR